MSPELHHQMNAVVARWAELPVVPESDWPGAHWQVLQDEGGLGWAVPGESGGQGLAAVDLIEANLQLARQHLTTTFILSQFQAACQRLTASSRADVGRRWLPRLASGAVFATVGISHLTTSRRHQAVPAVQATADQQRFRLQGEVPWVTGAAAAQLLVTGATLPDGQQILAAIPASRPGLHVRPAMSLLALTGSQTASVAFDQVLVEPDDLVAGPGSEVLKAGGSVGAGSLTTSALATGHAWGCLDALDQEARLRNDLRPLVERLQLRLDELTGDLLAAARGDGAQTAESLRTRATAAALDVSQAYLTAAKGAGFVSGHPAERRVREALFFLVWSCPQPVANRLLSSFSQCDL